MKRFTEEDFDATDFSPKTCAAEGCNGSIDAHGMCERCFAGTNGHRKLAEAELAEEIEAKATVKGLMRAISFAALAAGIVFAILWYWKSQEPDKPVPAHPSSGTVEEIPE